MSDFKDTEQLTHRLLVDTDIQGLATLNLKGTDVMSEAMLDSFEKLPRRYGSPLQEI